MNEEALEKKIKSLRKTLSWMDLVMANVNECILVLDEDWRIVFINSYMAELLGQDRVLLLGKYFWEVLPITGIEPGKHGQIPSIESISNFNGVYDLNTKFLNLKMLLQGKFVEHLQQAICIISNVSIELKASNELMMLHKKINKLEDELSRQKALNLKSK